MGRLARRASWYREGEEGGEGRRKRGRGRRGRGGNGGRDGRRGERERVVPPDQITLLHEQGKTVYIYGEGDGTHVVTVVKL